MTLNTVNTLYTNLEHRFLTTEPIRGRTEEVRPIGQRRRTWERIVRGVETASRDGDVTYWYGAHLYQTTVIKAFENGEVELACNGWITPSTAEFMSVHLPLRWYVTKQAGNLWLNLRGSDKRQLIPKNKSVRVRFLTDGGWEPTTEMVLTQRVVDKVKMREARDLIRPFLDFTSTMLKLSDGWVMAETLRPYYDETRPGWGGYHNFTLPNNIKEIIANKARVWGSMNTDKTAHAREFIEFIQASDTDTWQQVMYQVLERIEPREKRASRQVERAFYIDGRKYLGTIYDNQYTVSAFLSYIDAILKRLDVFTTRTVDATKVRKNLLT